MEHKEFDGSVIGHFCIDCDDWVVPEHAKNTLHSEGSA